MKNFKALTLAVSALTFASATLPALADNKYIGASHTGISYDEPGVDELNPSAITLFGGVAYDNGVSVEGRLAFGASDDGISGVDLEVNTMAGVYGKYNFAPEATFSPYVIVGFTYIDLTASSSFASIDADDTDLSFGIGSDINISDNSAITLDYMSYTGDFDNTDTDISAFSVGYRYNF